MTNKTIGGKVRELQGKTIKTAKLTHNEEKGYDELYLKLQGYEKEIKVAVRSSEGSTYGRLSLHFY